MPTTRSFVLEKGDEKKFWDITWDGPFVEITSGTWGTNGRAREASFESLPERDAYIAAQIARITKQGYREAGVIAPAPELPTPDYAKRAAAVLAKFEKLAEALVRPAWLPVFGSGDGAGRVRAPMTMTPDESWPACRHCKRPLSGVFELDMAQLPATHLRRDGVAQLFWCEAWEGELGEVCTAYDGWLVRWHEAGPHRVAGPGTAAEPVTIVDWTRIDELPVENPKEIEKLLAEADSDLVDEVLRSLGINDSEDYNAFNTYAKRIDRGAVNQHKLGGYPTFVQKCDVPFEHQLFQIEMQSPFDMNLGDIGAAHLLVDKRGALQFYWACH